MDELLKVAKSQIGTEEQPIGSNWGEKVKEYLASAAVHSPAPWCMAFVCWCFRTAFPSERKFPTTASCTFLLNWAKEQDKIVKQPKPGDVFLLLRLGGKTAFHTGIVGGVGSVLIYTIEGNSNVGGSPEGYEVVSRIRRWRWARVAFVRIDP